VEVEDPARRVAADHLEAALREPPRGRVDPEDRRDQIVVRSAGAVLREDGAVAVRSLEQLRAFRHDARGDASRRAVGRLAERAEERAEGRGAVASKDALRDRITEVRQLRVAEHAILGDAEDSAAAAL